MRDTAIAGRSILCVSLFRADQETDQLEKWSLAARRQLVEIQQAIVAKIRGIIDGMLSALGTLEYHHLQVCCLHFSIHQPLTHIPATASTNPAEASRLLLIDHVIGRNLFNEFKSSLKTNDLEKVVWNRFFRL